jgi:hypothetical protein
MMRVVDVPPSNAEIAASGLVEKYFQTDPDAYRYFVEQYRRDFLDFRCRYYGNGGAAAGSDPDYAGKTLTAADDTCIEAFDRSRPPFCYHLGSLYHYRIDRTGTVDRPIILDRYERSEVTGSILGIPTHSQQQGFLMRFCLWIEKRLRERDGKEKG